MTQHIYDPRDPKELTDSVSGVESSDKITNSEEQQLIDNVVAETDESAGADAHENSTLTENDKRDITGIN